MDDLESLEANYERSGRPAAEVAGVDVPTDHLIGGERVGWQQNASRDRSPIDSRLLAEVARGGRGGRRTWRCGRPREAFEGWAGLGPERPRFPIC